MASLFTKIVRGEIPCHRVYEDDDHLAFLDIRPIRPGHTLVIPKQETEYLFDMEPTAYARLWEAARRVQGLVKRATNAARVVVMVVGYEVPHVHIHLIPTDGIEDFPPPAGTPSKHEDLSAMAKLIQNASA